MTGLPKRPRQYAAEICKLKGKSSRREALAKVPPELQEMTKKHVLLQFQGSQRKSGHA
jgi:hypothetical protein